MIEHLAPASHGARFLLRSLLLGSLACVLAALTAGAAPALALTTDSVNITSNPALSPGFSQPVHDYVTSCVSGTPVQVTVHAPVGRSTVSVDGQPAQSGDFTVPVNLNPNQEYSFTINYGSNPSVYYVRCLPSDFPPYTATRNAANGNPGAQYYIATPSLSLSTSNTSPYVAIVDTDGVPVWWYNSAPKPINATLLPDGLVAWNHFGTSTGGTGGFEEHNLNGALVRTINAKSVAGGIVPADFHEIQEYPGGNYLLAWTKVRTGDLTQCGGTTTSGQVLDPVIESVDASGNVIWSWDTMDHIPLTEVAPQWRSQCTTPTGNSYDTYHFNAISMIPGSSDVVVSFRHLDAVYRINTVTGAVVWKLGGTTRSDGTSLTIQNDPVFAGGGSFGGQHDVRVLADQTVSLHDNGTGQSRAPRAVRYQIDSTALTATLVETVTDSRVASSACCGSARKLWNNDWAVGWGGSSEFTELTSAGTPVFTLNWGNSLFSYRTQPIAPGTLSRDQLRAGMNAQFPRSTTPAT